MYIFLLLSTVIIENSIFALSNDTINKDGCNNSIKFGEYAYT